MEQAQSENCLSVQRVCSNLRRQCPRAVPTLAHYVFIYDCLHEALCTNYAWFGADLKLTYRLMSRPTSVDGQTYFDEQFDLLCRQTSDLLDQSSTFSSCAAGRILTLNSYRNRDHFILTDLSPQSAPQRAADRLWRVVLGNRARCIVTFTDDEDTCANWSPTNKIDSRGSGLYELKLTGEEQGKGAVRWNTMKATKEASAEHHSALVVRHFVFTGWHRNDTVPACRRDEFTRLIRWYISQLRYVHAISYTTVAEIVCSYCLNKINLLFYSAQNTREETKYAKLNISSAISVGSFNTATILKQQG